MRTRRPFARWGFLAVALVCPSAPAAEPEGALGLEDLIRISLEANPGLRQAARAVDVARGRALQAGLYPNPTLTLGGEEIGPDGGIHTFPQLSQQIVTAGKLRWSRAVANREVDRAQLGVVSRRYELLTAVRQGYFEVLAAQRRVEVLGEVVKLAGESMKTAEDLLAGKLIAELDLLQFRVELNRVRAQLEAARRELPAARDRLAARMGVAGHTLPSLRGDLTAPLPVYDLAAAREFVMEGHPDVLSAQVGMTRAQLALRRAEAGAYPDVTVGAGYQRNFIERVDQATYQIQVPLPLFNRNQGNILAARAELARSADEVGRVQNELARELARAFGPYAAARERAERYRESILPDATRAYRLSLQAYRGGQFEYLRVIQAQRAVQDANLEYIAALAEAWDAASVLAGLLLEEGWPAGYCPVERNSFRSDGSGTE